MADTKKLVFEQAFVNQSSIDVVHNANGPVSIQLLVGSQTRPDLISSATPGESDPDNEVSIVFVSQQSGTIQVFVSSMLEVSTPSPEDAAVVAKMISDGAYLERNAGGFLYPRNVTDDIAVGGSAPSGRWFDNGAIVLGGSTMVGAERLNVVGSVLIDQSANAPCLDIDSEATGSPLINLQPINANTRGDIAFGVVRTSDPSAPAVGDFWYNTTDRAIKFRSAAEVIGLNGFLQEFSQVSNDAQSTTTSSVWQQKIRLSVTGIPAGTYRVGLSFGWSYSSGQRGFQGQVQVDDVTTVWSMRQEPQDVGIEQNHPAAGFAYVVLTAGNHNIDLDYRCTQAGDTARISSARLEFWRVA